MKNTSLLLNANVVPVYISSILYQLYQLYQFRFKGIYTVEW